MGLFAKANRIHTLKHSQISRLSEFQTMLLTYQIVKHLIASKNAELLSEFLKLDLSNQDCGPSTTGSLVSYLPLPLRSQMGMKLGEEKTFNEAGQAVQKVVIKSKEEAADCIRRILREQSYDF